MPARSKENQELLNQGLRKCGACGVIKPIGEFKIRNKAKGWITGWCKLCYNAHSYKYYRTGDNGKRIRTSSRIRHHTWKDTRWEEVLDNLGRACACCGEANPEFLTIDHINEDGWKEKNQSGRRTSGKNLWGRLRREGYPKDKYQMLCYNCNCGRQRRLDGICPHKATGAPEFISKGRRGRPRVDADTDPLEELKMAVIQSPFKDRVVPATTKKVGQDIQKVGPADLTIGISLPGSTAQGMVTNLVKGK